MNQLFSQSIKDTLLFNKNSDGNYQLVFIDAPQSAYHKKVIESLISNNVSVIDKSASEDVKKYENLTIVGFRVCLEGYSRLVMIIKRKKNKFT